ncbi:competence type IV pilus minor pilin ComGD [Cytobacillus horneckiae]|uniref:competence type IV pilus minor pilin ComGD n=1 Tax=Cytobacillus horneckiae TaxID=549687 RepID=UPI003D9AB25C
MKKNNNERGFTLIESLIVLSIFLLIMTISALMISPRIQRMDDEAFFAKFKADILYAQNYALANQTIVSVFILPDQNEYRFVDGQQTILTHTYNERYQVIERTMPLYFQFSANGNVNKFGYFYVQTDDVKYQVMFQIGRGRFYVTEE